MRKLENTNYDIYLQEDKYYIKNKTTEPLNFYISKREELEKTIVKEMIINSLGIIPLEIKSDGKYIINIENEPPIYFTNSINIKNKLIPLIVSSLCKDCSCSDCYNCLEKRYNFFVSTQTLINTLITYSYINKNISYNKDEEAPATLFNFYNTIFNREYFKLKKEIALQFVAADLKGEHKLNIESSKLIIAIYYLGLYLEEKSYTEEDSPDYFYLNTSFNLKIIKECLVKLGISLDSVLDIYQPEQQTSQDNISRKILVVESDLSGEGTIEEQLVEFVNSLNYVKQATDSDIWVELYQDDIPVYEEEIEDVDAEVSEWGEWSECIEEERTRTRFIITPAIGNGITPSLTETEDCQEDIIINADAEVSEWSEWSSCLNGQTTRTRTIITPAIGNGRTPSLIENEICENLPIDAIMSDWSDFNDCSPQGTQTRFRTVLMPALYGGVTGELEETVNCVYVDPNPEPVNAVMGEWSEFTECSLQGTKSRFRQVLVPAQNGGFTEETEETLPCVYIEPLPNPVLTSARLTEYVVSSEQVQINGGNYENRMLGIRIEVFDENGNPYTAPAPISFNIDTREVSGNDLLESFPFSLVVEEGMNMAEYGLFYNRYVDNGQGGVSNDYYIFNFYTSFDNIILT